MKLNFNTKQMLAVFSTACLILIAGLLTLSRNEITRHHLAEQPQLIGLRMPTDSLPPDLNAIQVAQPEFEKQREKLQRLHEKPDVSAMSNMDNDALKKHCEALQKNASTDPAVKEYAKEVLDKLKKMEAKNADNQ